MTNGPIKNLCWTLSRFAITAWVGAAALFVVTSIQEARSLKFDSVVKAELATLRFPTYYAFAFALVVAALVFAVAAGKVQSRVYLGLLIAALVLLVADYFFVYSPLQRMTASVEQAKPASFEQYHTAEMWVNAGGFIIWFIASLVACWPMKLSDSSEPQLQ